MPEGDVGESAGDLAPRDGAGAVPEDGEPQHVAANAGDPSSESDSPRLRGALRVFAEQHEGPLPSQQWLAGVERLAPGTTQRLIDDHLVQREHQRVILSEAMALDREGFRGFRLYQLLRLGAAWSLAVLFLAAAIVLIATGHAVWGIVALATELAGLCGVFLVQRIVGSDDED